MKRWTVLLAVAWQALGCTVDKNPPPQDYSPPWGEDIPVTCDYLRQENPPVGPSSRFEVDGGQAACAATGLECPMGACDGGVGLARCQGAYWLFSCGKAPEGGKDVTVIEAEAAVDEAEAASEAQVEESGAD